MGSENKVWVFTAKLPNARAANTLREPAAARGVISQHVVWRWALSLFYLPWSQQLEHLLLFLVILHYHLIFLAEVEENIKECFVKMTLSVRGNDRCQTNA